MKIGTDTPTLVDPLEFLKLSSQIPPHTQAILSRIELFCQKHLYTPTFLEHHEKAQFPQYLLPELAKLDIAKYFIPAPFGSPLPLLEQGLIIAAFATHDLGISSFLFLQLPLCARSIALLGSSHQQALLPDLMHFRKICGWALTEREVGSNSTRLGTTFSKEGDNWILNGNKRWIGNGVNDYLIVFGKAKQGDREEIIGALLQVSSQGLSARKIPNKYCFRVVQNAEIDFQTVKVLPSSILPGATSYKTGVETTILHSRLIVIWNTVGACIGIYRQALRQACRRRQVGEPVAARQLTQMRLVSMMGEVQTLLMTVWRLSEMEEGLEMGTVGMFKAWSSSRGRWVAALGRQIEASRGVSGSGLMRKLLDMQVMHTYEGSYEINVLLGGSQLTGIKAFL